MTLESTLYYITHHSETIIQWLFLAILLLASVLIGRGLFGKKPLVEAAGAGTNPEIQTFLQKILDQTAKLESVSLEKMSAAGNLGQVDAQVQALKKDLQSREEELNKLKAAGNAAPSADAEKLSSRIKELESKLSEYEILEDDIADLSLYKEENQRLKAELERVKGGGAPAPTPASASASAEPTAVVIAAGKAGEDIVAEFAQAVGQEVAAAAPEETPATDIPMDAFETALNLERKMQGEGEGEGKGEGDAEAALEAPEPPPAPIPSEPEPTPTPTPTPTKPMIATPSLAPAPAAEVRATEGDDLFAEFAAPVSENDPNVAHDSSLDTDKMMAEMAALVSMEPTKGTALEDSIDTEKMALEATNFHKS